MLAPVSSCRKTINFDFELDLTACGDGEEGNMSEGKKERLSDLRN
jgi:hypothetical protein